MYYHWAKGIQPNINMIKAKYDSLMNEILDNGGNTVLSGSLGDSSFTYSLQGYTASEFAEILEMVIQWLEDGEIGSSNTRVRVNFNH